jgi:hypothetical protein
MSVSPEKRTTFTEGPWRVTWAIDGEGEAYFDVLKSDGDADDDGRMVDASYSIIESAYPVIADDEAKANANLIAAAPDLYDALAELRLRLDKPGDLATAIRRADMALAYARGEDYRFEDES